MVLILQKTHISARKRVENVFIMSIYMVVEKSIHTTMSDDILIIINIWYP